MNTYITLHIWWKAHLWVTYLADVSFVTLAAESFPSTIASGGDIFRSNITSLHISEDSRRHIGQWGSVEIIQIAHSPSWQDIMDKSTSAIACVVGEEVSRLIFYEVNNYHWSYTCAQNHTFLSHLGSMRCSPETELVQLLYAQRVWSDQMQCLAHLYQRAKRQQTLTQLRWSSFEPVAIAFSIHQPFPGIRWCPLLNFPSRCPQ